MVDTKHLTDTSYIREYSAGQRISGTNEFYIIISGNVDIFVSEPGGRLVKSGSRGAGELCGAERFFGAGIKENFLASEKTSVFVIGEASFDKTVSAHPRIAYGIMQALAGAGQNRGGAGQPGTENDNVKDAIKKKMSSHIDQDSVAKVRDAFRQKYSSEKSGTAGAAVEKDFERGIFPEGHKSYPGIIRPEQMKFIYSQEYKCPHCLNTFQGPHILASKLIPRPMRYDMRRSYVDFSPEWYDVLTCPHCYFSIQRELFSDHSKYVRSFAKDGLELAQSPSPLTSMRQGTSTLFSPRTI
jgi:hypothetical protein